MLPRLNCPWRATATTPVVRSPVSGPAATIGAVRLVVPMPASSPSSTAVPACTTTTEQAASLFAALRISPERSFCDCAEQCRSKSKCDTLPYHSAFSADGIVFFLELKWFLEGIQDLFLSLSLANSSSAKNCMVRFLSAK